MLNETGGAIDRRCLIQIAAADIKTSATTTTRVPELAISHPFRKEAAPSVTGETVHIRPAAPVRR